MNIEYDRNHDFMTEQDPNKFKHGCIPYHTGSGEIVCRVCGKPMGGNPHREADNICLNLDHNVGDNL